MSSAWVWPLSRRRARVGALEPSDPTDGWQGSGSTYPPKSPGCGFSSPTRMIMKIYNVCCQPGNPDLNRLLFATSYWGWVGVDAKQWFVQNRFLLSKALAWLFWTCSAESPIYLIWLSIHPFCLSMYLIYTILFIYIYIILYVLSGNISIYRSLIDSPWVSRFTPDPPSLSSTWVVLICMCSPSYHVVGFPFWRCCFFLVGGFWRRCFFM